MTNDADIAMAGYLGRRDGSVAAEAVVVMRHYQFERMLDVPAVPMPNGADVIYDVAVVADPGGGRWFLRSYGTGFNILAHRWVRAGISRCYSVGWGLVGDRQSSRLLLGQAFDPQADLLGSRISEALRPLTDRIILATSVVFGRSCLRLAAELTTEIRVSSTSTVPRHVDA
jgi:hypothetical protein